MAPLKENGELDIERINELPIEEYMEVIGGLTEEQYKEYLSNLPINESKGPVRAVVVDYTLEDELARGCVLAEDFMNKMRKKYLGQNNAIEKEGEISSEKSSIKINEYESLSGE